MIDMQVDTEMNYELAMRFAFRRRRTGQPQALVLPQQ